MMILADTNIIIDFWKAPTDEVRKIFEKEDIYTCGVVVAELLHGATSEKDLNIIKNAMESFPRLHMEKSDWDNLGEMLYLLRKNGLTVPFQDAVIACLAVKYDCLIWTMDKHFKLMRELIQGLKLYKPENTISS